MSKSLEKVIGRSASQKAVQRKRTARLQLSPLPLAAASAVVMLLVLAGSMSLLRGAAPVRAVEIEARGVRFNQTNPPIVARVGERVEITVRNNEDRPVAHDFVLPALDSKTGYLQPGQSETVSFVAERKGSFKYLCTLHPGVMDGLVIVEDR